MPLSPRRLSSPPDPRLSRLLCHLTLAGLALVLVWPAARGDHPWFGWLPLWLVAMPAVAWWALWRCPLPRWRRLAATTARRAHRPQARRCRPVLSMPARSA